MRCPACGSLENKVVDSRMSKEGRVIRRRRACSDCENRFTTYERIEEFVPLVIKKDGTREAFDRQKILHGMSKACEKRHVSAETMEAAVEELERTLQEEGGREIASSWIGEWVMQRLRDIDEVAYVRFASVYRSFRDLNEFMTELKDLLELRARRDASTQQSLPLRGVAPPRATRAERGEEQASDDGGDE